MQKEQSSINHYGVKKIGQDIFCFFPQEMYCPPFDTEIMWNTTIIFSYTINHFFLLQIYQIEMEFVMCGKQYSRFIIFLLDYIRIMSYKIVLNKLTNTRT